MPQACAWGQSPPQPCSGGRSGRRRAQNERRHRAGGNELTGGRMCQQDVYAGFANRTNGRGMQVASVLLPIEKGWGP